MWGAQTLPNPAAGAGVAKQLSANGTKSPQDTRVCRPFRKTKYRERPVKWGEIATEGILATPGPGAWCWCPHWGIATKQLVPKASSCLPGFHSRAKRSFSLAPGAGPEGFGSLYIPFRAQETARARDYPSFSFPGVSIRHNRARAPCARVPIAQAAPLCSPALESCFCPSMDKIPAVEVFVSDFIHVAFKFDGAGRSAVIGQHQQMSHVALCCVQGRLTHWTDNSCHHQLSVSS